MSQQRHKTISDLENLAKGLKGRKKQYVVAELQQVIREARAENRSESGNDD